MSSAFQESIINLNVTVVKRSSVIAKFGVLQICFSAISGLGKSCVGDDTDIFEYLAVLGEKINKMDQTESKVFNADNAEQGKY